MRNAFQMKAITCRQRKGKSSSVGVGVSAASDGMPSKLLLFKLLHKVFPFTAVEFLAPLRASVDLDPVGVDYKTAYKLVGRAIPADVNRRFPSKLDRKRIQIQIRAMMLLFFFHIRFWQNQSSIWPRFAIYHGWYWTLLYALVYADCSPVTSGMFFIIGIGKG